MDTKAAFEKWCDSNFPYKKDRFQLFRGEYNSQFTRQLWQAWEASRAAIEIELPELAVDHDERLMVETSVEGAFNLGVIRSRQAITSHGIRIKGKAE